MVKKTVSIKDYADKGRKEVSGLVQIACGYNSDIQIETDSKTINAKSLFGVMQLSLERHDNIIISADGEDEKEAVSTIEKYLCSMEKEGEK